KSFKPKRLPLIPSAATATNASLAATIVTYSSESSAHNRSYRYVNELTKKGKSVTMKYDWKHINLIISFLKFFYDATIHISGSSYLTRSIYMFKVLGIGKSIV
ncbi:hypothetical protein KIW84_073514, partial [Lathyrus oleraceus]